MSSKECIAMLLAGGEGNRLGALTRSVAKPAVPFGGKYHIIDFTLSNCANSGIDTVGVLTQYRPLKLNSYIGNGQPWDLDRLNGGVYILPPHLKGKVGQWYKGTANAIYQNIEFIEQYNPQYILVLSGDHIYKMDYSAMVQYHKRKGADATIAVIEVPWSETSRFGIMNTRMDGKIIEFEEKPKIPKNNKASMGVYVFNWETLKSYLIQDESDPKSDNDFGKNIITSMLCDDRKLYAYSFKGYWKDVGTIESLWESNMDLLEDPPKFDLYDPTWRIYSRNHGEPPHYIAPGAAVSKAIVAEGSIIYGRVEHSVIFTGTFIGQGAQIEDSIIMSYARIGRNTVIKNAVIAEGTIIGDNCEVGFSSKPAKDGTPPGITVIGESIKIPDNIKIGPGAMIDADAAQEIINSAKEGRAI